MTWTRANTASPPTAKGDGEARRMPPSWKRARHFILRSCTKACRKRRTKIEKTALALVLAGGGSNLFDRFFRGYVVDYFSFTPKKLRHLVFNLGDLYIAAGMAVLSATELVRGLRRIGIKGVKH